MRLTLAPVVHYSLYIIRDKAGGVCPRTRINLGTMVSWNAKAPGDRQPKASQGEWMRQTLRQKNICAYVPVAPQSLVSPSAGWHSNAVNHQIGWVYCTRSKARKWFDGDDATVEKKARLVLNKEVDDYCAFIDGYVYRYTLRAAKTWHANRRRHVHTITIMQGGGFIGSEPEHNGMLEQFPAYAVEAYTSYSMSVHVHV
jgi:hypothetical protein